MGRRPRACGVALRVVLVHYHAPADLARTAAALRAAGVKDVVVVDNGSTEEEAAQLASLGLPVLAPGGNLGYGAALNLAVREAPDATEAFLALNPDALPVESAVATLEAALEANDVAGPRFWWNTERTALLPPAEKRGFYDEILSGFARSPGPWRTVARRRWRRHALRHHHAKDEIPSWHLSGAALAFRRSAWNAVDGFDERYRLYFEETDFLDRVRRRGGRAAFVAQAEVVHAWGGSSRSEPRAAQWFRESCALYRERRYGRVGRRLIERLERRSPRADPDHGPRNVSGVAWLEVAAAPAGYPAAMIPVDGAAKVEMIPPTELSGLLPGGTFYLRAVDRASREVAARTIRGTEDLAVRP